MDATSHLQGIGNRTRLEAARSWGFVSGNSFSISRETGQDTFPNKKRSGRRMTGFTLKAKSGQFTKAFLGKERVVSRAATLGMREVAEEVKRSGRAAIGRAGFSPRWQAAFRVDVYPKRGESINAAAFVHHNIPYAGVFEEGATISGSPYLWIPLPTAPKRIGREKITPRLYIQHVGKLIFVRRAGRRPLLAGRVSSRSRGGKVSVAQLRRGERDARRASATAAFGGNPARLKTNIVPLFVGMPSVHIKGRFGLKAIFASARSALSAAYFRNLRDE